MHNQDVIDAMRSWIESVAFVPAENAEYAPLVIDGLLYFIGSLPPARIDEIVAGQMALAADATADDRLVALLRQCPTLHKLGQVVARQAGLPLALRLRLQVLESLASVPGAYDVDALVTREIGRIPGVTVAADALAEGSVAVVIPFDWQPTPGGPIRRGVAKVLKPQAEERLLEDLAIWPALGDFLDERSARAGLAALEFRAVLDGVANLLRNEIRLDIEQTRLVDARRFYADSPDVIVPEVFAFSTPRLTAMERIDGVKATDAVLTAPERRSLARSMVSALLAKPFWSAPSARAFFHADPHAGNLFVTPDGKLAIFDWALTTELGAAQSAAVVQTLVCAALLDGAGVARALAKLGNVIDEADVRACVGRAIGEIRHGVVPGFSWLTALLDRLARAGSVIFPEQTALFRKSLLTLSGVVHDVCADASIDEVLVAGGGRQFANESVVRCFASAFSRDFGTHVSNDDLMRLVGSSTLAPVRFLLGAYCDTIDMLVR